MGMTVRATDAVRAKTFGNINVGAVPTPIPATPMVNRTSIAIFNNAAAGGATLFIGYGSSLNINNGFPVPPQSSWSEDIASLTSSGATSAASGGALLQLFGISNGATIDVRYTEGGSP